MRIMRIAAVIVLALLMALPLQAQRKEVIGYYPSWKWRFQPDLLTPDKLAYSKITILNYAFFEPLPDGSIAGKDSAGDAMLLKGFSGPANPTGEKIADIAHRNNVRIMLSLGGWEGSGNFPAVAADPLKRARFAGACMDFIREYHFDGIDIDWEYPGYAEHNGTPADQKNSTLLLQALRDSLNALGRPRGHRLLLTAALQAGPDLATSFEIPELLRLLDQMNVMTYDFYGPWDVLSGHNAPLYASEGDDSLRSVAGCLALYRDTFKVPLSKLNLGIPFYGHAFAGCAGLHQPHKGADTTHFPAQGAFYYNIQPLTQRQGVVSRDEKARVPTMTIPSWQTFVSYDDEESIREKARFVMEQGVHGVIIWELTGDYLADHTTPLLDALHSQFSSGMKE